MQIVYHNDLDGKCSAAIVYWFYYNIDADDIEDIGLIEMDYNREFPFERIKKDEKIFVLDWSFQDRTGWDRLLEITRDVMWIDHHKTAIEKFDDLGLKGSRDVNYAACDLTWKRFNPSKPMPMAVKLLADYDTWKFEYGDMTREFQGGIQLDDMNPDQGIWKCYFDFDSFVDKTIKKGKIALRFRGNQYQKIIKDWGFEIDFEGYHCIACNSHENRSQLFDSFDGDYDIMMAFVFDGKRWKVCLYTKRDDLDVSDIAKKYGGGGHRKAAGFICEELPF